MEQAVEILDARVGSPDGILQIDEQDVLPIQPSLYEPLCDQAQVLWSALAHSCALACDDAGQGGPNT